MHTYKLGYSSGQEICEKVWNQMKTARESHSESQPYSYYAIYNLKMLYKTNLAKTLSNGKWVLLNLLNGGTTIQTERNDI